MPQVGYDLWFFPDSSEFGESIAGTAIVAPLPPETVIFKAVYVGEEGAVAHRLEQARQRVATRDFHGREDVYLFRPTPSSDGIPFRSVLIYAATGGTEVERFGDPRIPMSHRFGVYRAPAIHYRAIRIGGPYAWEQHILMGHHGYFLTGISGAGELWRLARIEADALDRQILTLTPVRSPHAIVVPNFQSVTDIQLRNYLIEQFEAFRRAVASSAHFEVVDRAANIAEAILAHCLAEIERPVPRTLADRLVEAKAALEDRELRQRFPLSDYGYHLAHKIRLLHSQTHADQAVARGRTVRPEVGMTVAIDLSELLADVGLGHY